MKNLQILFILILPLLAPCQNQIPPGDDCQNSVIYDGPFNLVGVLNPNSFANTNGPSPLCPSGGVPHNIGWYSFSSGGGDIDLIFTITNCSITGNGVQIGMYKDCDFSTAIFCSPSCTGPGTYIYSASLEPCAVYNIFIDGCSGDYCDVLFDYNGNIGECNINTVEPINFDPDLQLESCKGTSKELFVDGGLKKQKFEWSVDNVIIQNKNTSKIHHIFPTAGTFQICVRSYVTGPNGSPFIYSNSQCSNITIFDNNEIQGPDRVLCYESANPIPFSWNGVKINQSGIYRYTFKNAAGCNVDSVVNFTVLDKPSSQEYWHIGSHFTDYFVDYKGNPHKDCHKSLDIGYKGQSGCNDYILINQYLPSFSADFEPICLNGQLYYKPIIQNNSCFSTENASLTFHYTLIDKINPNAPKITGKDALLIPYKSDFQLLADVDVNFGTNHKRIKVDLGKENIDELQFLADGGRDIQTYKLSFSMNASNSKPGSWRFVSGPGTLTFSNANDPKTDVVLSKKGTYFVEWLVTYQNCTYSDRVKINCGEFFNDPNKKKVRLSNDEEVQTYLVPGGADIRIKLPNDADQEYQYFWINLFGQLVGSGKTNNPSEIKSPTRNGTYILKIVSEESDNLYRIQVIAQE